MFLINPLAGQISLTVLALLVFLPVNTILNKIANRDVLGRVIANYIDPKISSPEHENVCSKEETFLPHSFKFKGDTANDKMEALSELNPKHYNSTSNNNTTDKQHVQSPKEKKSLVIMTDPDIAYNLYRVYQSGDEYSVYKKGRISNSNQVYDELKLGRDFGEKYDFSYGESQRAWCKIKFIEAVKAGGGTEEHINEPARKVDFSSEPHYAKYRVMHGLIDSTIIALLQGYGEAQVDDQGKNSKYKGLDLIGLNRLRAEREEELLQDVKEALKHSQDCVQRYLAAKGFDRELAKKVASQMEIVRDFMAKCDPSYLNTLNSMVRNWRLDRQLHNLLEFGDEYQVLDDVFDGLKSAIMNQNPKTDDTIKIRDESLAATMQRALKTVLGLNDNDLKDSLLIEMEKALQENNISQLKKSCRAVLREVEKINGKDAAVKPPKVHSAEFTNSLENQLTTLLKDGDQLKAAEGVNSLKTMATKLCKKHQDLLARKTGIAIQESDYPTLAELFRENDLLAKANNHSQNFGLFGIRDFCEQNKLLFNNLKNCKGPYRKFDEWRQPVTEDELTSEQVNLLFAEGLVGTLVDPSKAIGFSDPNLHHVALFIESVDNKYNNPELLLQVLGRARGLDPSQKPVVEIVTKRGVKIFVDTQKLLEPDYNKLLFEAINKYNKVLLPHIASQVAEEVISHINDELHKDSNLKESDEDKKKRLQQFCLDLVMQRFEDLYNRNEHDLERTYKEFVPILKSVEKLFKNYKKILKNKGRESIPRTLLNSTLWLLDCALYYLWVSLNYVVFSLRAITVKREKNEASNAEATANNTETYVHIIKNYYFRSSISRQQVMETLFELTRGKESLFADLVRDSMCKKVFKKTVAHLTDAHLRALLNVIYPEQQKEATHKIALIRSLLSSEEVLKLSLEDTKKAVGYIFNINKEIVAAHAWYHDAGKVINCEETKLKGEHPDSVFYANNICNTFKFVRNSKRSDKILLWQVPLLFIKWFALLVITPQIPYLIFMGSFTWAAVTLSTLFCIPVFSFVFANPEQFMSFIFNHQNADCNKLRVKANEKEIPVVESMSTVAENILGMIDDPKKLDQYKLSKDEIKSGVFNSAIAKLYHYLKNPPGDLNNACVSPHPDNCSQATHGMAAIS